VPSSQREPHPGADEAAGAEDMTMSPDPGFIAIVQKAARQKRQRLQFIVKGGKGSGWFAPPKGTHVAGAKAGVKRAKQIKHKDIPHRLINKEDGGIGPTTLFHGTSNRKSTMGKEVYLTTDAKESVGYAKDLHRLGLPPRGGAKRREVLAMKRKPGAAINIDDAVIEALMEDYDVDETIMREAKSAKKTGFRYLYFTHPSFFSGQPEQDVIISLFPNEDLQIVRAKGIK